VGWAPGGEIHAKAGLISSETGQPFHSKLNSPSATEIGSSRLFWEGPHGTANDNGPGEDQPAMVLMDSDRRV